MMAGLKIFEGKVLLLYILSKWVNLNVSLDKDAVKPEVPSAFT